MQCEYEGVRRNCTIRGVYMEKDVNLKFFGPYKLFGNDNQYIDINISQEKGIYLWTLKYGNGYLVDYIGETGKAFQQRMKEHLIETLGGYYRICDPDMLLQGKERIIWNGLWREGTRDKIVEFIKNYENLAPIIKRYIEIHDIFLAPLTIDRRKRVLIEGNIAKIIKRQKPPISNLLPTDIRYIYNRKESEEGFAVVIECNENILGLPIVLEI